MSCFDGWFPSNEVWIYSSATSFTISGIDRTSVYAPGTKIKLDNNGSTIYGIVKSSSFSSNTTVNLVDNTDYSLNNSTISNPYYSYENNPQGHPGFFNLDLATITGFSNIDGYVFMMEVIGKTVHIVLNIQGTSNASTLTFPAPINTSPIYHHLMNIAVEDNSIIQSDPGILGFSSGGSGDTILLGKTIPTFSGNAFGGFTSSGAKGAWGHCFYPIA